MAQQMKELGFCGLGAMGFGMATNLVKQGWKVHGYDVSADNLKRFEEAGGIASSSLKDSATNQAIYVVMVANMQQAQSVLFESDEPIVPVLPEGATLLLCSTVPSTYAQKVAAQLKQSGRDDIFFLDAPVSGGAGRAAAGTLSIMVGASDAAVDKGRIVLEEMSEQGKLYIVNGGVGQGSNMKMVHQVLAAIQILAASEALGFAAHLGLKAAKVREAIINSDAYSWMFENRSPRAIEEDYLPPVSALTIILKDAGIITSMGRELDFPVPLVTVSEQIYLNGLSRGWAADDDAAMVRWYYPKPVKNINAKMNTEEEQQRISLVIDMLKGIHAWAGAEALAFSRYLEIPDEQFIELVMNAAGASAMFKQLYSKDTTSPRTTIAGVSEGLNAAVNEAQALKCPLPLASSALNLVMSAKRKLGGEVPASSLVECW